MMRRTRLRTALALLVLDVLGLYLSVSMAQYLRLGAWGRELSGPFIVVALLTLLVFYLMNLYSIDRNSYTVETLSRCTLATVITAAIIAAAIYMTRSFEFDPLLWRSIFLFAMIEFLLWANLTRYLAIRFLRHNARSVWFVMGNRETYDTLKNGIDNLDALIELRMLPESALVTGFDPDSVASNGRVAGGIVVSLQQVQDQRLAAPLMRLRMAGMRVLSSEEFFERFGMKIPVQYLGDNWFVLSEGFDLLHHTVALRIKRLADICISSLGLLLMIVPCLVVGLLVRLEDRGPALYRQKRTGRMGEDFLLYKFRTMVVDAERGRPQWAGRDDPRVTRVGRWLRKTRFDELPQLWNVLRGDMSFVGPRPERPEFNALLEEQIPYYDLRHLIKPGMTGWAQVMYPYGASVEDAIHKLEYDLFYIKNYSLVLDLFIILRTAKVVLSRAGQ